MGRAERDGTNIDRCMAKNCPAPFSRKVLRAAAALVLGLVLLAGATGAQGNKYDLAAGAGGDHTCMKDVEGNLKCW